MLKNFKLKNTSLFYSLQCLSGKKSSGKRIFLSVSLVSFLTYFLCPRPTLMVATLFFCCHASNFDMPISYCINDSIKYVSIVCPTKVLTSQGLVLVLQLRAVAISYSVTQQNWIIENLLNAISHLRLCSCCYFCLNHLLSLFTLFINPYLYLTVQLRYHFLFLPGWIRCPILLYISTREIRTLNQFKFLFKSKLEGLFCSPPSSYHLSRVPSLHGNNSVT